jgi:hypothetical protein
MRRKRNEDVRLRPRGERRRIAPASEQPVAQCGINLAQECDERGVEAREPLSRVEILEGKIEGEAQQGREL